MTGNPEIRALEALIDLMGAPLAQAIGWALVQFVWQGALIGAVTGIALVLLRRSAADVRYTVSTVALALMLTLPVVTAVQGFKAAQPPPATPQSAHSPAPTVRAASDPSEIPTRARSVSAAAFDVTASLSRKVPAAGPRPLAPWLLLVWTTGVLLLTLRLLTGWLWVQRLRTRGVSPARAFLVESARRLARQLHVSRPVRLLESALVEVPVVIGWLKPVVLLPATALAGLTPQQLEAILAHELAHIRRHDYFVNLLQTLVETLLFYHPAVWFVSRQIRIERENCCDDLAVSLCGDPVVYAQALADLEGLRGAGRHLALAASGGSLLHRVRRLLGAPSHAGRGPGWLAGGVSAVLIVLIMLTMALGGVVAGAITGDSQETQGADRVRPDSPWSAPRAAAESVRQAGELAREGSKELHSGARELRNGVRELHDSMRQIADDLHHAARDIAASLHHMFPQIPPLPPLPPDPPEPPAPPSVPASAVSPFDGEPPTPPEPLSPPEPPAPPEPPSPFEFVAPPALPLPPHHAAPPVTPAAPVLPAPPGPPGETFDQVSRQGQQRSTYTWSRDGEKLEVEYRGDVVFTDDDTDVKSLTPGGLLRIKETGRAGRYAIEFRADGSGAVERRFWVGTSERPFEPEGRVWVVRVLPQFIRQTAIGAPARVGRIFKSKGAQGVLAEIALIEGSWAKRVYFAELFRVPGLDSRIVQQALAQAGREVDSDFELASLLISADRLLTLDDAARKAYFDAARTIGSDFEMRRTLASALKKGVLTPPVVASVLESSVAIESDFEEASLLVQVAETQPLDDAIRGPFFKALSTVQSDFEQRRVLTAVMKRTGQSPAAIGAVIAAAANVGSDFELASVLLAVVKNWPIEGTLREPFFRAVESIASGFERGRVLQAVARRPDVSEETALAVIKATQGMGGSFEPAQVLLTLAGSHPLSRDARDAYIDAAETLGDFEQGRVLSALVKNERRR